MRKIVYYIFLFAIIVTNVSISAHKISSEQDYLKRIQNSMLIENPTQAIIEAKEGLAHYPDSQKLLSSYIQAAAKEDDIFSISLLKDFIKKFPDSAMKNHLVEEVSWGILNKGIASTQYNVRLTSMIGAFLTHDVRSTMIVLQMLDDSNALLRSISIQLACQLRDFALLEKISNMLTTEKVWLVRLELIRAIGILKIKNNIPELERIAANDRSTYEEKSLAIESLVNIYDEIDLEKWRKLSQSSRSGLRQLACELASHYYIKGIGQDILCLIQDTNASVRISALNALALNYLKDHKKKLLRAFLKECMQDSDPCVAITASWVAFLIHDQRSEQYFTKWISHENPEHRRLAIAALVKAGKDSEEMLFNIMQNSKDPYVQANAALGLIGQRKHVKKSCDILFSFIEKKNQMWMWTAKKNRLFQMIAPSELRHTDQIPHYPEAIDQLTHLRLLSILAILDDKRSIDLIKAFLDKKTWGITGTAVATLLQEGDEDTAEAIRAFLTLEGIDNSLKTQAAWVLAMIGKDPSAAAILQNIYFQSDYEQKQKILEALGTIAKVDMVDFFLKVFDESSQILRIIAASSCIQAVNH